MVNASDSPIRSERSDNCVPIRIVGCGRWSMGDDRAGLLVAEMLKRQELGSVSVCATEDPLSALVCEDHANTALLLIVDAAQAKAEYPPGTFASFTFEELALQNTSSSLDIHSMGVSEALELAKRLGMLPDKVRYYVIFGSCFDRSLNVDRCIEPAVAEVARRIEQDVIEWKRTHECMSSP